MRMLFMGHLLPVQQGSGIGGYRGHSCRSATAWPVYPWQLPQRIGVATVGSVPEGGIRRFTREEFSIANGQSVVPPQP